jgi:hypothetical protein
MLWSKCISISLIVNVTILNIVEVECYSASRIGGHYGLQVLKHQNSSWPTDKELHLTLSGTTAREKNLIESIPKINK